MVVGFLFVCLFAVCWVLFGNLRKKVQYLRTFIFWVTQYYIVNSASAFLVFSRFGMGILDQSTGTMLQICISLLTWQMGG